VCAIVRSDLPCRHEVVVVDDGANGDLAAILAGLPVRVMATGGLGSAAAARNCGAAGFAGAFLVFVDADVVVRPDCLRRLLQPLMDGRAEATVGNYASHGRGLGFAARYKQLYIAHVYGRRTGYLRNDFWTAACAVRNVTFRSLGGFDAAFRGACGEDAELGCRLTRAGGRTQGAWFAGRAFATMVALDWLRLTCALVGATRRLLQHVRGDKTAPAIPRAAE
jgi:GT2 family glycosyltransferase